MVDVGGVGSADIGCKYPRRREVSKAGGGSGGLSMSRLKVRWIRPWGHAELAVEGATFSTALVSSAADALLCEWAPSDELLNFPGPASV